MRIKIPTNGKFINGAGTLHHFKNGDGVYITVAAKTADGAWKDVALRPMRPEWKEKIKTADQPDRLEFVLTHGLVVRQVIRDGATMKWEEFLPMLEVRSRTTAGNTYALRVKGYALSFEGGTLTLAQEGCPRETWEASKEAARANYLARRPDKAEAWAKEEKKAAKAAKKASR